MSKFQSDNDALGKGTRQRIDRLSSPPPPPSATATRTRLSEKGSVTVRARHTASLGLALAVVTLVGGLLLFRAVALTGQTSGAEPSGSAAPSGVTQATVKLSGPAFDLAYDQSRHSLWFKPADQATLFQYDTMSGKTTQLALPSTEDSGELDRVALAPDGSIWVATGYTVTRVDPASGSKRTHTFALADPDANSAALDANALSPGTWVSAITFDSAGMALIARHNVTSLVGLDASLNVAEHIPMPASMAGPGSLAYSGGVIYAAPFHGGPAGLFSEQGALVGTTTESVSSFSVSGSTVAAIGPAGPCRVASDGAATPWGQANQNWSPYDLFVAAPGGAALYLHRLGVLEWFAQDGQVEGTLALPVAQLRVNNPGGSMVPVAEQDQIGALASDGPGSIWFVDVTSLELVHAQLI